MKSFVGAGNGGNCTINIGSFPAAGYAPLGGPSPVNFSVAPGSGVSATYAQNTCRGAMTLSNMTMWFNQITGAAQASATSCSISGTALTTGGTVTGTIAIGQLVGGAGVLAGTKITGGSSPNWTVNQAQTVALEAMTFSNVASVTAGVSIAGGAPGTGHQSVGFTDHLVTSTPFGSTDTQFQDSVADGQTYGVVISGVAGSATGIIMPGITFEQVGVSTNYVQVSAWGSTGLLNTSALKYVPLATAMSFTTTEANAEIVFPCAATMDHLQVAWSALTGSSNVVVSRHNGGIGQQTASLGSQASSPPIAEDTQNHDTILAGDTADYQIHAPTGTVTFNLISSRLSVANPNQSILMAGSVSGNSGTNAFCPPGIGAARCDTVKGEVVIAPPFNGTLSGMNVITQVNANGVNFTLLKGSVGATTGRELVSLGAGVLSGQDTQNQDSIVVGTDQFTMGMVSVSGSVTLQSNSFLYTAPGHPDGMTLMGVG